MCVHEGAPSRDKLSGDECAGGPRYARRARGIKSHGDACSARMHPQGQLSRGGGAALGPAVQPRESTEPACVPLRSRCRATAQDASLGLCTRTNMPACFARKVQPLHGLARGKQPPGRQRA